MSPARRRAAGLVAVAVALAVACTFLGRWQWHRHVDRAAAVDLVETNWRAPAVPLEQLVDPGGAIDPDLQWRTVTVVGRYVGEGVLLRNRPVEARPAYHVLGLVEVASTGALLVVDRGWVPASTGAARAPAAPTGEVTLTVRLRPLEDAGTRSAPAGQVQTIAVAPVAAAAGVPAPAAGDAYGAFGTQAGPDPVTASTPDADALGQLPPPDVDLGSHLSYAFQWWVFALGALVSFSLLARRELVDERAEAEEGALPGPAGDEPVPAPEPRPVGARRAPRREGRAEEEEDRLVDAWLQGGDRR
ncbi:SURF1 family protein [Cellulomonas marina]|uniref:SURF1-like protein n=1 Tax=Cellulomonas marina TaxID=988821 RepID=A0A1I0ZVI5_9CELL|nr:SURF1 family protein [Cellulomonas marina]GIG28801.1 hypothetical protein Cma02nite_14010 [Cellulomonas marina]SFB28430.1 Cytochrome oxidase assembly protein ShyY1 [Cellulomonas marina]